MGAAFSRLPDAKTLNPTTDVLVGLVQRRTVVEP